MPRVSLAVAVVAALCVVTVPSAQTRKPAARKPAATRPAAAKPAARKEQPVPFKAGERLTYDIGWSSYVTAGVATMTVLEKKPSYNSTAYYVVAEGRPTPLLSKLYTLYYKADTLLDVFSLLPQRGSVYSEEGRRRRMKSTMFNHPAKTANFEVKTATVVQKGMKIPAYSQDALSALYVLRSIPLKSGDKFNIPVVDNGNVYTVQMNVGNVEQVKTGIGTVPAIKVMPTIRAAAGQASPGRGFAIWISQDPRRLPVRIEAQLTVGTFNIVLSRVN